MKKDVQKVIEEISDSFKKEISKDILKDVEGVSKDEIQKLETIMDKLEAESVVIEDDYQFLLDKALSIGAMDYIIKPFTPEDAMQIVQKITEDIFFSMEVL